MSQACFFFGWGLGRVSRPCAKCLARKRPFAARAYEANGRCEWWAAMLEGDSVAFRCFPGSEVEKLPKTPADRARYIGTECDDIAAAAVRMAEKDFKHRPKRGVVRCVGPAAAWVARLLPFARARRFRFATACEVAQWRDNHQSDFNALVDG